MNLLLVKLILQVVLRVTVRHGLKIKIFNAWLCCLTNSVIISNCSQLSCKQLLKK